LSAIPFDVYFSSGNVAVSHQPAGSVLLYPSKPTWNDFGFQVRAKLRVRPLDERPPLTMDCFVLAIEDDGEGVRKSFAEWITTLPSSNFSTLLHVAPSSDNLQFVTLLGDDATYRSLAEWAADLSERLAVLFCANDLNLARVENVVPSSKLEVITRTDAFTLGVMRSSAAYRAYHKGARYITREELLPLVNDARGPFQIDVKLRGFEEAHRLGIQFSQDKSLVSDRAHVFIGKNGTGKTQLLRQVIGSLARQADKSEADVFLDQPNSEFHTAALSGLAIPNAVLLFSSELGDLYPQKARLDTPLDYSYFSLAAAAAHTSNPSEGHIVSAIRDLVRDDSLLRGSSRLDVLGRVLGPVIPSSQIHLPIRKKSARVNGTVLDKQGMRWLALDRVSGGEQQRLYLAADIDEDRDISLLDSDGNEYPPSSGQRVYLRFAAKALSVISVASLLLLDEPETHLHPNFISEFMTLLHEILEATNSIALIATHSPFVVREVPGHCVRVFVRAGGVPEVTGVHLRTLGASVSSISDAVFGDATARKFHNLIAHQIATKAAGAALSERERVAWVWETYGHELNTEMLSTIRFLMNRPPAELE